MTRFLFVICALVLGVVAFAEAQNPLRDRLLRNDRSQQTAGWYQRADTGDFFLFDRSNTVALLKERDDDEAEVMVLFGNRAPGGGTSFVTDTGREIIRVTGLGGTTYFPYDAPDGVIAEYASPAGGLAPQPRSPDEVRQRAVELANELARILDRDISVEYTPAPRAGLGVQYDAINVIEQAFRDAADQRRRFRDVEQVDVTTGDQPGAYRVAETLVVVIAPAFGYAGRPSSGFIADALLAEAAPS